MTEPLQHLDPGIGEGVRHHLDGAVIAQPQENAGRQQNFRAALFGAKFLSLLDIGELPELCLDGFIVQIGLAFHHLNDAGMRGNDVLGVRRTRC